MPTVQELMDDIDLRYRNTYTDAQKLVWLNEGQDYLFEIFEIDAPPYEFSLVNDQDFYPIPDDIDINKIKVASIQISPDVYEELPFIRNDDHVGASKFRHWYTIISDTFFINVPGGASDDYQVVFYYDTKPEHVTDMEEETSVPARFTDMLKLYVLEQIAKARKDVVMGNNYASEFEKKMDDLQWQMTASTPEFISAADANPKIVHGRFNNYEQWFWGR